MAMPTARFAPEHLELARKGLLGSTLNVRGAAQVNALQRAAVEGSRLKIPLIFAFDVIHGYRTIFPIPLGEAASWDPAAAERSACDRRGRGTAAGVTWTFAPMVDIARDARWGRIAEGAGEDPFLGAAMAARPRARLPGRRLQPPRQAWSPAPSTGSPTARPRPAATTTRVDISERTLRSIYFPPFKAAVDAGVGTFMSAFNDLNGVPASANHFTLTQVLRGEWKFDGLVVSDYNSVIELINHGFAADAGGRGAARADGRRGHGDGQPLLRDARTAARQGRARSRCRCWTRPSGACCASSSAPASSSGPTRIADRRRADDADPGVSGGGARDRRALDGAAQERGQMLPLSTSLQPACRHRSAGRRSAEHDRQLDRRRQERTPSPCSQVSARRYPARRRSCTLTGASLDVAQMMTDGAASQAADRAAIAKAVAVARTADAVVLVIGESGAMSGEASSRTSPRPPGSRRSELAQALVGTGKPVAVVLMNGRPLNRLLWPPRTPAILEAWFPGTEAGHAVADVLFGRVNPGGKLPVTFPRTVGQAPIYYNHKSPDGRPIQKKNTRRSTSTSPWTPLYPFGHGLSYTHVRDSRICRHGLTRFGLPTR